MNFISFFVLMATSSAERDSSAIWNARWLILACAALFFAARFATLFLSV